MDDPKQGKKKRLPKVPPVLKCKNCGGLIVLRAAAFSCCGNPAPTDDDVRKYLGREPDKEQA